MLQCNLNTVFSREQEGNEDEGEAEAEAEAEDEDEDEDEDDDEDEDEHEHEDDEDEDEDEDEHYEDDLIDLNLDQDDNPYISSNSSTYPSCRRPVPFPFLSIFSNPLLVPPPTVLVPETPSPTSPKSPLFSFTMSETPSPHKKNTKFFFKFFKVYYVTLWVGYTVR